MKPDITDCSLSDREKIKMLEAYIEQLRGVLLMVDEELCFGGDWKTSKRQIKTVLE